MGPKNINRLTHRLTDNIRKFGLGAMDERQSLRRQPDVHNFGSLMMLAVTAGAFLLVIWIATKGLFLFLQESPIR